MKPGVDYVFAFMTGIFGSFHCMGMCGGLVSAFFMKIGNRGLSPYFYYHIGRITSYTFIGTAAASLGMALTKTGLFRKAQGIIQIAAGMVVIIIGLDILGVLPWRLSFDALPISSLKRLYKKASEKGPLFGPLLGGIFNGFIPCSLVFVVAIKAASTGEPLQGAFLMVSLGLGTLPSMLLVSFVFSKIGARARGILSRLAAVTIIAMGIWTLYKGYTFFTIMRRLAN